MFGSWALPQITKSGHKYFMTTNQLSSTTAHHDVSVAGIDGTKSYHFITTTESHQPRFYTYNGNLNPKSAGGAGTTAEGHQR